MCFFAKIAYFDPKKVLWWLIKVQKKQISKIRLIIKFLNALKNISTKNIINLMNIGRALSNFVLNLRSRFFYELWKKWGFFTKNRPILGKNFQNFFCEKKWSKSIICKNFKSFGSILGKIWPIFITFWPIFLYIII